MVSKIGLIGVNGFGRVHVENTLKLMEKGVVECIAFADIKVDSKDELFKRLIATGAKHYIDYKEMLDNHRDLDFVAIATPIALHKPMAVYALNKGFNVLLEKPPSVTIQDTQAIVKASQKSGKLCGVDFQNTSGKAFKKLIHEIQKGTLGEIQRVIGVGMWKRTQSYYDRTPWAGKLIHNGHYVLDGTINNPLAHLLNNCLIVAGKGNPIEATPEWVQAELYKGHDIEGEDTTCVKIHTKSGVDIMYYTTLCNPREDIPYIKVIGSEAEAVWDYSNILDITYADGKKDSYSFGEENLYKNMFLNMVEAITNEQIKLNSSIEDCVSFVLASNGAFESCGRTIKIPEEHLIIEPEGDTITTLIKDLDRIFHRAISEGKLFSEIGVEWAVKTKPFPMEGYSDFELFKD
ncbi:MAG TPA: Gfo/Idh/MocA family oxidoreductase [Clostridia bacterium]|nr:Gfo/Idh/MocA family oxidoreductase [Clostridia bacterium]